MKRIVCLCKWFAFVCLIWVGAEFFVSLIQTNRELGEAKRNQARDKYSFSSNGKIKHSDPKTELALQYLLGVRGLTIEERKDFLISLLLKNSAEKWITLPFDKPELEMMSFKELADLNYRLFYKEKIQITGIGSEFAGQIAAEMLIPQKLPFDYCYYYGLTRLEEKYGAPRLRLLVQLGADDLMGVYGFAENTIYLKIGDFDGASERLDYLRIVALEEFAHAVEHDEHPYRASIVNEIETVVSRLSVLLGDEFNSKFRDKIYTSPHTNEYQVHKIISPRLLKSLGEEKLQLIY